jgi:hypothetical protein
MEVLVPITLFVGAFAMVFGIRYLSNKEKMAMIERGIDPGINRASPKPFQSLKFGLLMVGLGIGLLLALFVVLQARLDDDEAVPVYFGLLSVFGGFGLIASYIIEKKWLDNHPQ